ncbi:MAG: hypothetical protein EA376_01505 [Phycisphaeraceae bacterium]|nr:MAG: hypothetical protein EA376_01505 [Phycisphaeraceae bacterium]
MEILGLIAIWIIGSLVWPWLFPGKCRHSHRFERNGLNNCPQCEQERTEREKERARLEHERKQQEQLRAQEIERRRRIESERLRQLSYLQQLTPIAFEQFVLEIYRQLGWSVTQTPVTGDNGIDGLLEKDSDRHVLQCKRFKSTRVGAPILRDLLGATIAAKASRGILVTTSSFTAQAREWARDQPLTLVDGLSLINMMQEALPPNWIVPREWVLRELAEEALPTACPICSNIVRRRHGRYGPFLGCTLYPRCTWTMNLPHNLFPQNAQPRRQRHRYRRRYYH